MNNYQPDSMEHNQLEFMDKGWGDMILEDGKAIFNALVVKYGKPSYGRNRAVFNSKHHVIKFPRRWDGFIDNDWEASVSHETLAKGRLITIRGIDILVQEKLNIPEKVDYSTMPEWVNGVDCGQVGYDKNGNLKAYDFGIR